MVMNSRFYNQNQDPLSFYQDFEQNHRLRQQEQQQHQFSEALTCGSQNGFWSSSVQGQHCNSGYFIKSLFRSRVNRYAKGIFRCHFFADVCPQIFQNNIFWKIVLWDTSYDHLLAQVNRKWMGSEPEVECKGFRSVGRLQTSNFLKVNKIFPLCLDAIHGNFQQKLSLEKSFGIWKMIIKLNEKGSNGLKLAWIYKKMTNFC